MRRFAHQVVDMMFDHVEGVEAIPVLDHTSGPTLRSKVAISSEPKGRSLQDALGMVNDLRKYAVQLHHPSYMGHQVCPPLSIAAVMDFVISMLNQSVAVSEMSPIETEIERELIRWLADRVGYPEDARGTTVSGGSIANLTGLLAARARWQRDPSQKGDPVIICSAEAHYSVTRAAMIMGLPETSLLQVRSDRRYRMDLEDLERTLAAAEEAGKSVLAIVATAGSTPTGSFDDLEAIALLRDRFRTWLHVDAAHGASAVLSTGLSPLVAGLSRADSFSWDPHKMMWMPLSFGVVMVRHGGWLRAAFETDAPYLFHREQGTENLGELTIQCSRRGDAVKLWMALKVMGVEPFGAMLDHVTAMTRYFHEAVEASEDFEAMHEPEMNIFCFRYKGGKRSRIADEDLDRLNATMRERLNEGGEGWLTTTVLRGRRVLRATVINPRTTTAHVDGMLGSLRRIAAQSLRRVGAVR